MVPGCPSSTRTSQSPSLLRVDLALGLPLDTVDRVEAVITVESSKLSTSSLILIEGRADASSGVTGRLPSALDSYPSEWTSSSRDFSDERLEDISSLNAQFVSASHNDNDLCFCNFYFAYKINFTILLK